MNDLILYIIAGVILVIMWGVIIFYKPHSTK